MKRFLALLLLCAPALAQSPDANKYAPRPILLLTDEPGAEPVMPMTFPGGNNIEFVRGSQIKDTMAKGWVPIRMGDVTLALKQATDKIAQLQAENERLWAAVAKPQPAAPVSQTVVVNSGPTSAQIAAQERQAAADRRQQAIMFMLQNRPQPPATINLRYTNCNRFPASCVGN